VRVLRPLRAWFATVTESSKYSAKGVPQPVSGRALASFSAMVESPIRWTVVDVRV
jgi:hypothetical protein